MKKETEFITVTFGAPISVKHKKPYTVYSIEVKHHSKKWTIYKRYRDFHELDQQINKYVSTNLTFNISNGLPKLPSRRIVGQMSEDFVEKRRVCLEEYLQQCLKIPEVSRCVHLLTFLEASFADEQNCKNDGISTAALRRQETFNQMDRMMFSVYLPHKFPLINEQVEAGLYTVKRTAWFLQKVCKSQKACATQVQKFYEHEQSKLSRIAKDKMTKYVRASLNVKNSLASMVTTQEDFAEKVLTQVVQPLLDFFALGEAKRVKIASEHGKVDAELKELRERVNSERDQCLKLWEELRNLNRAIHEEEQISASKCSQAKIAKTEAVFDGVRMKTEKAFSSFRNTVSFANSRQTFLREKELARLYTDMECLELQRLSILSSRLKTYHGLLARTLAPYQLSADSLEQQLCKIDRKTELKTFVDKTVQRHGHAPPMVPIPLSLPCSPDDIAHKSPVFYSFLSKRLSLAVHMTDMKSTEQETEHLLVKAIVDYIPERTDFLQLSAGFLIRVSDPATEEDMFFGHFLGSQDDKLFYKSMTQDVLPDVAISLSDVVSFDGGIRIFRRHLQSEYSEENLNFWLDVEGFRQEKDLAQLCRRAHFIVDNYVRSTADTQINIKGPTQQQIISQLSANTISADMFELAQIEVFSMMQTDSFSRFKQSALFEEFLAVS